MIAKINGASLTTLDQLKEVYAGYDAKPQDALLEVLRNHSVLYFVLKP